MTKRILPILLGTTLLAAPAAHASESSVNLLLNSHQVSFEDVAPFTQEGRAMLPFRKVFETLGAEIEFDDATKTGVATIGGRQIYIKDGESQLTIVENGENSVIDMDVPATTVDGRFVVPVNVAAKAAGIDNISWDEARQSVILTDFDAYFERFRTEAPTLYKLLNKSIPYPDAMVSSASFSISSQADGPELDFGAGIDVSVSLADGILTEDFVIDIDHPWLVDYLKASFPEYLPPSLDGDALRNIEVNMIFTDDTYYLKTNAITRIYPQLAPLKLDDKWIKFDLKKMLKVDENSLSRLGEHSTNPLDSLKTFSGQEITGIQRLKETFSQVPITTETAELLDAMFPMLIAMDSCYTLTEESDLDYTLECNIDSETYRNLLLTFIDAIASKASFTVSEEQKDLMTANAGLINASVSSKSTVKNGFETSEFGVVDVNVEDLSSLTSGMLSGGLSMQMTFSADADSNADPVSIPSDSEVLDAEVLQSLFGSFLK